MAVSVSEARTSLMQTGGRQTIFFHAKVYSNWQRLYDQKTQTYTDSDNSTPHPSLSHFPYMLPVPVPAASATATF